MAESEGDFFQTSKDRIYRFVLSVFGLLLLLSDKRIFEGKKGLVSICEVSPLCYFCCGNKIKNDMGRSTHFFGQPLYGQVINLLDKSKILQISRENGGERYTKRFNIWGHLLKVLYAA